MATSDFHSEWVTIGQHRLVLVCRSSFPNDHMRFLAKIAVEVCDNNSSGEARLHRVFLNDKASTYTFEVASTAQSDKGLERTVASALENIYGYSNFFCDVRIVDEGNRDSDHYCHMEHLQNEVEKNQNRTIQRAASLT